MKIYFYPHTYLRDRQLDTIRNWPDDNQVLNQEIAYNCKGGQVTKQQALSKKINRSWKQIIPLLNIKKRPSNLPEDTIVYVWGGLILTGKFIVDIDNPWALVCYNLRALPLYKHIIRKILLSKRCLEIRCVSEACREGLRSVFGTKVYYKAKTHYPYIKQMVFSINRVPKKTRFLFIGTQFEIKGGEALLYAFTKLYARNKNCQLTIITHLPKKFELLCNSCPGIILHNASFTREEIHKQFMKNCDVLVLPTYVESFGMVVLEALSYGLAIIATDIYALKEMVSSNQNGELLSPPISIWDGYMPSAYYYDLVNIKKYIHAMNTENFENALLYSLQLFVDNPAWRLQARQASIKLMKERFAC